MKSICGCNFLEEQAITRHGIVNPRSRENQSIVTTESGNHDRCGHAHRSWPTEDGVHHCYGYAVVWRVLDFRKRQHRQISKVSQQIKYDHNGAPSYKRAHEIFSRIAYFAADKCHIGPCRLRKEWTDHRSSKKERESERAGNCKAGLRRLRIPAIGP